MGTSANSSNTAEAYVFSDPMGRLAHVLLQPHWPLETDHAVHDTWSAPRTAWYDLGVKKWVMYCQLMARHWSPATLPTTAQQNVTGPEVDWTSVGYEWMRNMYNDSMYNQIKDDYRCWLKTCTFL